MNSTVRICTATSTTQLLALIHILRNEPRAGTKDILLWYSLPQHYESRRMLVDVIKAYAFHTTHELIGFTLPTPRKAGPVLWPFHLLIRHRHDANKLRALLATDLTNAGAVEIWTDEPIHFPMRFLHGLFSDAVHVKFPHGLALEDATVAGYQARMSHRFANEATLLREMFWRVIRLTSGVRYSKSCGLQFDRAYTFDTTSLWSTHSVDVSHLITDEALKATYRQLPSSLRDVVEDKIRIASPAPRRPWALLLLFGLTENLARVYRDTILRVNRERPEALAGLQLVLKPHPLDTSELPRALAKELSEALNQEVTLFDCTLNLDILWSVVAAKLVLAGPCGALPIVRRLGVARPVVLREICAYLVTLFPDEQEAFEWFSDSFEVW